MDCSLPGSSVHGIFQAKVLEWVPSPSLLSVATTVLIRVILVARDKNSLKSLQEVGDYGKVYIYMGNQEKRNTQVSEVDFKNLD